MSGSRGALQVLGDCPACRVECALVELVDPSSPVRLGRCRLCAHETANGATLTEGQRFVSPGEVRAALEAWAGDEGESLDDFVASNFGGLDSHAVAAAVLRGDRVFTSFDVVAWLFKDRTGGMVALGAGPVGEAGGTSGAVVERSGAEAVVGTPAPSAAPGAAAIVPSAGPDPRAVTRALAATALADGAVIDLERDLLRKLAAKLGAPDAEPEDWRAWRPNEVGVPPDPAATIAAMRTLALVDRIADPGEARVIREFARAWHVRLTDNGLPAYTLPQKFTAGWSALFGR